MPLRISTLSGWRRRQPDFRCARPTTPAVRIPHEGRRPTWSLALTTPIAALISARARPAALFTIKAAHTAIFFSVGALIMLFVWDGVLQRPRRRTAVALAVILAESAIYASNNQVCPLTPLAEELGAERGSVADVFLPDWFSRRIPLLGGVALLFGIALNARVWIRTVTRPPSTVSPPARRCDAERPETRNSEAP